MAPLTDQERRQIKSQLSMALCNCGTVNLFWLPRHRKIATRSLHITRAFRLPDDAVLVGQYSHGIATADVLGDLADLLATLPDAPPAAPGGACYRAGAARR